MTDKNTAPVNDTAFPGRAKTTIAECQHNAVILQGLIEGIDLMTNEGKTFDQARCAVTMVALRLATQLANDLDEVTP